MLVEPLLLQLTTPLPAGGLLQERLEGLGNSLLHPGPGQQSLQLASAEVWLAEARSSHSSAPLVLAIAQQLDQLDRLLHSRALIRDGIEHAP